MIKLVFADGTTTRLEDGVELPLEPIVGIKVILTFESGLIIVSNLPEVVGIVEE